MSELLAHSPLGASGTHRWMECPASVGLSHGVDDEEDDTFSKPGIAAHAVAEACLREDKDAWQFIGCYAVKVPELGGVAIAALDIEKVDVSDAVVVDKEMADAVQMFLDAARNLHPDRNQGNTWIERHFHCPSIHELFYGTSDLIYLEEVSPGKFRLHVWDFKYGAGIVVEPKDNPQLMYYACGALELLNLWDTVNEVVLHVAQPRAWHWLSPMRDWTVSPSALIAWLEDTLVPAMDHALASRDTKSGEHCRFCPARYRRCPQLDRDMKELEAMLKALEGKTADALDNVELSRYLNLVALAKIVGKAAERTAFIRLQSGKVVPGFKLSSAKANREWKDGAEAAAKKLFGKKAETVPELKSPAQIETLPGGEAFAARWAFKPDKGLTLVKGDDTRPAVNKDTKSLFQPVKRKKA